jgi:hypothetical protein
VTLSLSPELSLLFYGCCVEIFRQDYEPRLVMMERLENFTERDALAPPVNQ